MEDMISTVPKDADCTSCGCPIYRDQPIFTHIGKEEVKVLCGDCEKKHDATVKK